MSEIAFTRLSLNWNVPGVYSEYSNRRNQASSPVLPQKLLLIGQKLASGIAAAGVPVLVTKPDQAGQLAGRGSQAHHMAIAALRATSSVPVWLLPLDDAAGASKSTRTVTVTGSSSEAGTIALYVGGRPYLVNIAAASAAAATATAIAAAINADDLRHVDAVAAAAVVTLTARHGGVDAGFISCILNRYSDQRLPAGVTVAIGNLTAGTGNPDLAAAIAAIKNLRFPSIALGIVDEANMELIEAEVTRRDDPIVAMQSIAFAGVHDSIQNSLTFSAARNNPFVSPVDTWDYLSPKSMVTAAAAAVSAAVAQNDPAAPEQRQPMPAVLMAKPEASRREPLERNQLINGGVSTTYTDESGTSYAEYFVTSYRKNDQGVEDLSRFSVCHTRLWAQTVFGIAVYFTTKYPNSKLGQNGSQGANVVTPNQLKSDQVSFYKKYIDQGWFEGGAAFEKFKQEAFAEIESTNANRANLYWPPDFMNQLRTVASLVEPVG